MAKYEYPLFATFAGTRWATKAPMVKWGADDIKAPLIGAKGSKTAVIRVFPPGKSTRKCKQVGDAAELARIIVESFKKGDGQGAAAGGKKDDGKYLLPKRRASLFERRWEATAKEQEDFNLLAKILKDLNIRDINKIDEAAQEKILAAAGASLPEEGSGGHAGRHQGDRARLPGRGLGGRRAQRRSRASRPRSS